MKTFHSWSFQQSKNPFFNNKNTFVLMSAAFTLSLLSSSYCTPFSKIPNAIATNTISHSTEALGSFPAQIQ